MGIKQEFAAVCNNYFAFVSGRNPVGVPVHGLMGLNKCSMDFKFSLSTRCDCLTGQRHQEALRKHLKRLKLLEDILKGVHARHNIYMDTSWDIIIEEEDTVLVSMCI